MKTSIYFLALALLLAGCSKPSQHELPDVLATVGPRLIRVADWDAEVARRQAAGQSLPPREQVLDEMIQREALLVRALELGLGEAPEIRRRYENLLIAELKERELKPKLEAATVRPEEIRSASKQAQNRNPAQIRLAVLQLTTNPRTTENKRAQLAARLAEAREKALHVAPRETGFGALAVDYSDDQSTRYTGGDKGWFNMGATNSSLAPEVISAAAALSKTGEITDVIQTDRGFFLVRLMDRRAAGEPSLTAQEPIVQQRLLAKERKGIESEFGAAARSRVRVEINTPALAALHYQATTSMAQTVSLPPALP